MSRSVADQIEKERKKKMLEMEREKRLRKYHKDVLSQELPPLSVNPKPIANIHDEYTEGIK